MSAVVVRCPGCNERLTCTLLLVPTGHPYHGRWLVPEHQAHPLGNTAEVQAINAAGYEPLRITLRCPYSGAFVERAA